VYVLIFLQRFDLVSDYETLPRFFWRYKREKMIPSPEKNFPFAPAQGDRADNFSDSDKRTGANKGLIKCRFIAD
jgi:hypothetical protein